MTQSSCYADDVISMPNYGEMISEKKVFRKQNSETTKAGLKAHTLNYTTVDLWICGDLVCEIGTYGISLTLPEMTHSAADNEKYLNIWERQSDRLLKTKAEIWNTDVNPWNR